MFSNKRINMDRNDDIIIHGIRYVGIRLCNNIYENSNTDNVPMSIKKNIKIY